MAKTRKMISIVIVSLFTFQSSKSMGTVPLLKQKDNYGICIPTMIPVSEKAQWINDQFIEKHTVGRIKPHIPLLQAQFSNDQLEKVKTFLTEYVKLKNPFEIMMASQIVSAENNNSVWYVDRTSEAWSKLQEIHQEIHLFLKTQLPGRSKSPINFIGNTYPHYKPHCPVAHHVQDKILNKEVHKDLLSTARYLKFTPDCIALVCIDPAGNIKSIIQYYRLNEEETSQKKRLTHTNLLSNNDNAKHSQILALLLKKHCSNKPQNESNKENNLPVVTHLSEMESSEEGEE